MFDRDGKNWYLTRIIELLFLAGLNSLQSGLHKQHMKDLFVELCLTVPVRLSSLLPYLPMLMDPLVSALNGSQTLISQGLRTLELCVDNLQPDFLYDHIQPVRADLMQVNKYMSCSQSGLPHQLLHCFGSHNHNSQQNMGWFGRLDCFVAILCFVWTLYIWV